MTALTEVAPASSTSRPWVAASFGAMCSALPAFLVGAMSVQIRNDLGLSLVDIGISIATAFAVAGATSASMGRLAQALGSQRSFQIGLTGTAIAQVLIALFARDLLTLSLLLAFSGLCNALNQPSANLLLSTRIVPERLGTALAVKQAGMPAATLLGGAAVPLIALTVGWRYAFAASACLALAAMAIQPPSHYEAAPHRAGPSRGDPDSDQRMPPTRPDMATPLLLLYALVGYLAATAATAMANLLTSAATAAGIDPGLAGWLLSAGSALGILSRLAHGWLADTRNILPIRRVVWLTGIGAAAFVVLAAEQPITYLLAAIPAFGAGWAWPGLFNLSVIRNNPSAPASATGISQMGIFLGAGSGPLLGGIVVEQFGFRVLWLSGAALLLISAILAHQLSISVRKARLTREAAQLA